MAHCYFLLLLCILGGSVAQNYFLIERAVDTPRVCIYEQGKSDLDCTDIVDENLFAKLAVDERDGESTMVYWVDRNFAAESIKRQALRSSGDPEVIYSDSPFVDDMFIDGDYLYFLISQGVYKIPLDDISSTPEQVYSGFDAHRINTDENGTLYILHGKTVYKCPESGILCDDDNRQILASIDIESGCSIGGFDVNEGRVYFAYGQNCGINEQTVVKMYYANTVDLGQEASLFADVYPNGIAAVGDSVFIVPTFEDYVDEYDLQGNLIESINIGFGSSTIVSCTVCGGSSQLSISVLLVLLLLCFTLLL